MATGQNEVVQVSIPLPRSLDTRIFIRLATQAKALVLSLTTASQEELGAPRPMGSFVYALPDVSPESLWLCISTLWLAIVDSKDRDSILSRQSPQHSSPPSHLLSLLHGLPN